MDALRDYFLDSIKSQTYLDDLRMYFTLPYLRDELGYQGLHFDQIRQQIDLFIARSNITVTRTDRQTGEITTETIKPICNWHMKPRKGFSEVYQLPSITPPDLIVTFVQE